MEEIHVNGLGSSVLLWRLKKGNSRKYTGYTYLVVVVVLHRSIVCSSCPLYEYTQCNIYIHSIPSKHQKWMYERTKNINAKNQSSIHCSCKNKTVNNSTFWRTLVCKFGYLLTSSLIIYVLHIILLEAN